LQGQKKAADHVACRRQNPKKPNENNLPFCIACLCSSAKTTFIRVMQQESHQGDREFWQVITGLKPVNIFTRKSDCTCTKKAATACNPRGCI
jgi:hypothetical protein